MAMVTHQMLGEALLHNFRGSSYNSKNISHIIYSFTKRNRFFQVLLTSQSITIYTVPKTYRKQIGVAEVLDVLAFPAAPQKGQNSFFPAFIGNKPFSVSTLFGAGAISYFCRLCCNQVYNWF